MRGAYEYVLEAIADYVAPVVSESEKIIPQAQGNADVIDQLVDELEARPTTADLSTAPATPASLGSSSRAGWPTHNSDTGRNSGA